ncbi:MAG TPA: extracellular solute-binding protein [Candidatus Limnocylindrales bacterium]|nr:extracellular solute-binding protein [Candidatus Limnocylindrales bacterium]
MRSRQRIAVLLATASILLSACAGASTSPSSSSSTPASAAPPPSSAGEPSSAAPVTVDWWHITTGDPGKADFQAIADAYTAAHPNVTIKITVLENEAFKTKLATQIQAGDVPDLFQSWGGGIMAAQVDAGALKDITSDIASWKDTINAGALSIYAYNGKQYGVPWDMGMIGFWYNKDAFTKAGISGPPATWDDFLADVGKLRASGIAPLAIAGKDEWPSMHLWTYLVLRIGGGDNLAQMIQSKNWNTDACTKAGQAVQALNALNPYQDGYKSATYNDEAAAVGNGKAAMELMGQWAPSVQKDQSANKQGLGDKLGWFPFPTVAGGAGAPTDGVGGGNGIAVGKDAPPEAIDFLKFFLSADNANKLNTDNVGLSPVAGTTSTVKDPNLQAVLAGRDQATFMQLYLDQATSPAMGQAINDATVGLFLGSSDPAKVCGAITDAAATN